MFFSNTNRTNLTNLVGCDMVYIRGIREICGQLNTPVILHSICSMALCEPAATELESKNTHGVSDLLRSLFTDLFFDLYFDFRLIVPWQDKRDFRRILCEENCEYYFLNTNLSHESFLHFTAICLKSKLLLYSLIE